MNWQKIKNYPIATYGLLIIQVLVFLWEQTHGGSYNTQTLIQAGAKVDSFIIAGQWWRLITPIFVHIGWMHILLNSLTLYFVGIHLELMYGKMRFLILYLLSGIGGNLMSFALGNPETISAGASTSLFGLFGVYVALGIVFRGNSGVKQWSNQFLVLIFLNLVTDLFAGNIDIWGHVGGALSGVLLGIVISLPQVKEKFIWRFISTLLLLLGWILFYFMGVN
ncbi:rhomboid family intramembrane serine protease [Bombilactobacillus thymidiniphilus]|uniref:Rhomboid family intramembrane serine protease n=1 Tax=Bombilactobacillus thymidiniphilus TaxID=2923363 RepID=A0ABY4PCF8_9LACO|nr:rhomboid family intramembrane serine protease [Bombilactobacillus thymidiniphilus]UQS83387.1 rhomboid family intramembrane serine protease [Bombilactobacillus thymidiniphilus]